MSNTPGIGLLQIMQSPLTPHLAASPLPCYVNPRPARCSNLLCPPHTHFFKYLYMLTFCVFVCFNLSLVLWVQQDTKTTAISSCLCGTFGAVCGTSRGWHTPRTMHAQPCENACGKPARCSTGGKSLSMKVRLQCSEARCHCNPAPHFALPPSFSSLPPPHPSSSRQTFL